MSTTKDSLPVFSIRADPRNVGQRWLRNFELYAEEKDITVADRKRAALLRRAGDEVQDVADDLERERLAHGKK